MLTGLYLFCFMTFLNDVDIQLILEIKESFRKYNPVCPKNPQMAFFLRHPVYDLKCHFYSMGKFCDFLRLVTKPKVGPKHLSSLPCPDWW